MLSKLAFSIDVGDAKLAIFLPVSSKYSVIESINVFLIGFCIISLIIFIPTILAKSTDFV